MLSAVVFRKSSEMVLRGIFLVVFVFFVAQEVSGCRKVPPFENYSRRTRGDNGYRLIIGGEPNGYEPGKIYNLFLLGSRTHLRLQQFTHFMLSVQASSTPNLNTAIFSMASPKRVGRFQLFGDSLTKFNENCVNTVSEADDFPKTEIQVMWVAPASGSGCVALSAMVYENQESWFSDDGGLTKIICEGKPTRQSIAGECCACDDAKYNVSPDRKLQPELKLIISLVFSLSSRASGPMKLIPRITLLPCG